MRLVLTTIRSTGWASSPPYLRMRTPGSASALPPDVRRGLPRFKAPYPFSGYALGSELCPIISGPSPNRGHSPNSNSNLMAGQIHASHPAAKPKIVVVYFRGKAHEECAVERSLDELLRTKTQHSCYPDTHKYRNVRSQHDWLSIEQVLSIC